MSGVSYQKYMEWLCGQELSKPLKKPNSEPVMGTVSIPDAPLSQTNVQTIDRPIRDLNVRFSNGTILKMHHVSLEECISVLQKLLS